eukprot:4874579-Lingulodinium_polyedra.AAC.1
MGHLQPPEPAALRQHWVPPGARWAVEHSSRCHPPSAPCALRRPPPLLPWRWLGRQPAPRCRAPLH